MSVWRLNDEKLLVTDVQTFPTAPMNVSRQRRLKRDQTQNNGREGGENLRSLGWDLPRITIVFKLLGDGQPKTDELEYILNEIEENEVITLEAPDTLPIHTYIDQKRAPLTVESWNNDPSKSQAEQTLRFQASVLGQWIQDGGQFCETIFGHFKKTDNAPTYEREDGSEQGDLTITVDAQTDGYLKAKNPNTLQWDTLTPSSTGTRTKRDGTGVPTETYDLSGYLFPSDPSSVGDVGLFEIRQSPLFADLELASATLTNTSLIAAAALIPTNMAATLSSASSLTAKATKVLNASATLTDASAVNASARIITIRASATLTNASSVTASAVVIEATPIGATIQNASAVNASATKIALASATLTNASSVSASARITTIRASATIQNASAVNASARNVTIRASATLSNTSSVTANPAITVRTMSATIQSASAVNAVLRRFQDGAATIQASSSLSASATVIKLASATIKSESSITARSPSETTVDAFESGDLTAYSGDTA